MASNARCLHRFRQCARSPGLDNEIDPATIRPFQDLGRPIRMHAIIYAEIRTDRPCMFQLFIGRGCHDDSRVSALRKLESKDGYAAGAKYQYIALWLEFARNSDCPPRGQPGGRQSRSFRETPILGNTRKELRRSQDHLSRISIDTIAWSSSEACSRRISRLPIGKEG